MNDFVTSVVLFIFGLMFGSFGGAMVWRLRARQLVEDKAHGEDVDEAELAKLSKIAKVGTMNDRSVCLACNHRLSTLDLIPLLSWIGLKGRCRYCKARIGSMEPLIELGVASFFVLSFVFWPYHISAAVDLSIFVLWLVAGVGLAILFAYDTRWFLLPNRVMFPVIGIGALSAIITIISSDDPLTKLTSVMSGVAILSGLYLFIWLVSKGKWVGFGDVKLGLALALLLADWRLAFLALFAANLVGTLVVAPGLLSGKLDRQAHVPFGPLLIIGFGIAGLAGQSVISLLLPSL